MTKYKRLKEARERAESVARTRQRVLVDLPNKKFEQHLASNPAPIRSKAGNWPNRNATNTVGIRAIVKKKYTPVN
tara:strand:- start:165 stop:389 length:225 start_codon:yes stop_codon:yes gene_type:complete